MHKIARKYTIPLACARCRGVPPLLRSVCACAHNNLQVQAELPLAVRLATGDGGPDRVYRFSHQLGYDPRHLVMFEHVEGATFCEVCAHIYVYVCACVCVRARVRVVPDGLRLRAPGHI